MKTNQAGTHSPLGIGSFAIAVVVGGFDTAYVVLSNSTELSFDTVVQLRTVSRVGAALCAVGIVLGFLGIRQERRNATLAFLGLLFNVAILIGFLVMHLLGFTQFY